jgi:hypothetical protein
MRPRYSRSRASGAKFGWRLRFSGAREMLEQRYAGKTGIVSTLGGSARRSFCYHHQMLHVSPRLVLLFGGVVGALGAAPLGCAQQGSGSRSVTTDAATATGSSTSGAGGAGGASSAGGAGPLGVGGTSTDAGSCVFPSPDDPGGDAGLPAQSWCAPTAVNPPDCPVDKPLAGSACSTAGLQCAYEKTPETFLLATCNQTWVEVAHWCNRTCAPSASSVATPQPPSCGALADIQCVGGASSTNQERADLTLRGIAACCGAHSEAVLVVWFEDGCAAAASGPPDLVSCMNGLLAGRRFDCAKELSCAMSEWSTLP